MGTQDVCHPPRQGVVLSGVGGLYTVLVGEDVVETRARGILKRGKSLLYVGDRVSLDADGVIEKIFPRKNCLTRPPIANLDKLLIVVALCEPAPNLYTIDKLTVAALFCGAEPILVLNKTDLSAAADLAALYTKSGFRVYSVCGLTGQGVEDVRLELQGAVCAFAGFSGVGKSTILNALCPGFTRQTGEISKKLQRGKHTTRSVDLSPAFGGFIADTPGFSELDLAAFGLKNREELAQYIPEFLQYLNQCRFRDCTHRAEPDCAVTAALTTGEIARSRYESFLRMWEELGPPRLWETC